MYSLKGTQSPKQDYVDRFCKSCDTLLESNGFSQIFNYCGMERHFSTNANKNNCRYTVNCDSYQYLIEDAKYQHVVYLFLTAFCQMDWNNAGYSLKHLLTEKGLEPDYLWLNICRNPDGQITQLHIHGQICCSGAGYQICSSCICNVPMEQDEYGGASGRIRVKIKDDVIPSVTPEILFDEKTDSNSVGDAFDLMTGLEFESYFAEVLKKNGFDNVTVTQGSGDQGIDIIAYKDDIKYGIQCKCYSGDIGNKAVQEVFSGKAYYGCHVGVVVTNRFFTKSARELARANGIILWDRDKLIQMISADNAR